MAERAASGKKNPPPIGTRGAVHEFGCKIVGLRVGSLGPGPSVRDVFPNCKGAAMSRHADSSPNATADDREARLPALRDRLRPLFEQTLSRMAEALTDLPDDQLFGPIERTLRDQVHDLAADAHTAALAGRKKEATRGRASSAPAADTTPASTTTSTAPSTPPQAT